MTQRYFSVFAFLEYFVTFVFVYLNILFPKALFQQSSTDNFGKISCNFYFQAITNEASSDNKEVDDKKKLEEDEAKKIVESITDSITSGEKKDIEESTRDIVKKAALAVGSLKETEFDIRLMQSSFLSVNREKLIIK